MVLFLDEKGEVGLENIAYSIWPFIFVLLENGEYAIIAICLRFIESLTDKTK